MGILDTLKKGMDFIDTESGNKKVVKNKYKENLIKDTQKKMTPKTTNPKKAKEIEEQKGIEILFAVESGSRAWVLLRQIRIMTSVLSLSVRQKIIWICGKRKIQLNS